ncbi:HD domain-containing protein [bacterium]|nr:HD domain-containing protein [bacterium]
MDHPSKYIITTVHVDELKNSATIIAYTGFSDHYTSIDRKVCAFLHHNFGGSKVLVSRNGKKVELPVEQVREGDTIIQIFSFPSSKKRLTVADPKLAAALKKKGILSFKIRKLRSLPKDFSNDLQEAIEQVNLMMRTPSRKQERLKLGVFRANKLVEKVKEEQRKRKEGSDIIEHLMDSARQGKLNMSDIEVYVDNVVKHSSSEAMSAIANLKSSDQTYSHCIDVGVFFQTLYFKAVDDGKHKSTFQTKNQMLLGAFLHDFGKSQLPKELLDSTARFDTNSREMQLIKKHPQHGAKLLTGMSMPDSIVNMSLYHHVKMDESLNTSYPEKLSYNDSTFETKLLSVIDIYQALVGKRSYKRSWTPPQAMRYLSALAGIEYEESIWDLFLSLMGEFPVGSLVILNDDSMGFVMNVPEKDEDLLRPQVVIIRNAYGEDLEKHTLVDLQEEKDLFIKSDVSVTDVFSSQAINRFSELRIVA